MSTVRIYQSNPYEKNTTCRVVDVIEQDGKDVIVTDQSVFFPIGGGQPSDVGIVAHMSDKYSILRAYDDALEGPVYHVTDAPTGTFSIGDEISLSIDWDKRFINMQRHCGEHMLSGAFHKLYGGVNKGFHMGEDYIAIDIELGGRILTSDEIARAEDLVNAAIRANLPVEVHYFDSYEGSRIMPVRKDVPHKGRISVVTIGSPDDYFDCIACCGTHPRTTAEVGLVAVYKAEPNKGMTRVFFDCGRLAIDKLKHDYATLTSIANSLSTSNDGVPHKLEIQAERESSLKARIASLSTFYKEKELETMARVIDAAKHSECGGSRIYTFDNELLEVNELLKLGFQMQPELGDGLLILRDIPTSTVLLLSDGSTYKCGDIAKEKASSFGGRGGGRPDNARVAFKDAKEANAFIDYLLKMKVAEE